MRNEDVLRLASKLFNKYEPHSPLTLTLSPTFEAVAAGEVYRLHALGEHDLVDSTLRVGRQRGGKV